MKTPHCLRGRRRHYFGREIGTAGGMGNPRGKVCLWCGWNRGYTYTEIIMASWKRRIDKGKGNAR